MLTFHPCRSHWISPSQASLRYVCIYPFFTSFLCLLYLVALYVHIVAYRRWGRPLEWGHAIVMLTTVGFTFIAKLTKRSYPVSRADMQQTGRASPETLNINHCRTERLCVLLPALISHCITISCREVEWTLVQHKCHRSPKLSCIAHTYLSLSSLISMKFPKKRTLPSNSSRTEKQWNNSSCSIWLQKYGINFLLPNEHPQYMATCFTRVSPYQP